MAKTEKKIVPRNWVAVDAHFRRSGPMGDRRKKRMKDKEERELRETVQEALEEAR